MKLVKVDKVLKNKEAELEEKTQVVASHSREINEAREAGSSSNLWTTFHRAPDTDFRQFGQV